MTFPSYYYALLPCLFSADTNFLLTNLKRISEPTLSEFVNLFVKKLILNTNIAFYKVIPYFFNFITCAPYDKYVSDKN